MACSSKLPQHVDVLRDMPCLLQLVQHKLQLLEDSIHRMEEQLPEMCLQAMMDIHSTADTLKSYTSGDLTTALCDTSHCPTCSKCTDLASLQAFTDNETHYLHPLNTAILLNGGLLISGGDNELLCCISILSKVWSEIKNIPLELSSLLTYIIRSHSCERSTVVVDARGAKHSLLSSVIDSLHSTQKNTGNSIDLARILIDRPTQTGTIVKSIQTSRSLPVDILTSERCLLRDYPEQSLPIQLGGKHEFKADEYVQFHEELARTLSSCMQSISGVLLTSHTLTQTPKAMHQCPEAITHHKETLARFCLNAEGEEMATASASQPSNRKYSTLPTARHRAMETMNEAVGKPVPTPRPNLAALLLNHKDTRQVLRDLETYTKGADIYCPLMEKLNTLSILTTSVSKLRRLADERLCKLYGYEKLWHHIEDTTKMLTLLKRSHELINAYRLASCNLRVAKRQLTNFNKSQPSITKLLQQGNRLLESVKTVVSTEDKPIVWLEQLGTKLQTELSFVSSLLTKTQAFVSRTYDCYVKLEQVYNWAVDAMKLVSQHSMEDHMTAEALEMLVTGLKSFMQQKTIINDTVFDEISREARFLTNRKLSEQCKMAKKRYGETRQLVKVRLECLAQKHQEVVSAMQESPDSNKFEWRLESSRSAPATPALTTKNGNHTELKRRSQSLEDDIAGCEPTPPTETQQTNIKPAQELDETSAHVDELYPAVFETAPDEKMDADGEERAETPESTPEHGGSDCHTVYRGDKVIEMADVIIPLEEHHNNNHLVVTSPALEDGHVIYAPKKPTFSSASDDTIKVHFDFANDAEDTEETSKEVLPRSSSSDLNISQDQPKPSPVLSLKQKQKAMQKRRSFHGFTSALTAPLISFAKSWKAAEDSAKRHSVSELPERMEDDCTFKERESSRRLAMKRMDKTISLVTSSSDSLPSLPEDDVVGSSTLPMINRHRHSDRGWTPVPVNSHLINKRVLPTQRCSSMADLRLTETEIKRRITLAHIMDELVQTESDYVVSLRLVVNNYIPEMAREDVPQALRGKRAVIFSNIEKIYEFHSHYFLEDLAKCENDPFKIGQCFLKHESQFMMYALYNKNKPKSDALMSEHGSAFFKQEQRMVGDKMDLSSYLLKPVQRMCKYALILKQLIKECPEKSPEYQELVSAEEMVKFCLQHGNDLLAMDALQECDVNLQEQGTLLLQDEFVVWKNKKKVSRHLFLFEQMLIMSKTRRIGAGRDQYTYKTSLKTADIGLTENVGEGSVKFSVWFRKRTGENWTMEARSAQVKNRWVSVIEKLLWTQALKNRESKLTELSTMGVGRKPCLDLKESSNNINDRFIPTINKPLGKRHSMDSLDLCDSFDGTKKRPYSTISLANSSSSGSSAGSTGPGKRRSQTWLDLKAAVLGKGVDSTRRLSLKSMYKSDSKIYRCDSGISNSSDAGQVGGCSTPPSNIRLGRKESETEV